MGAQTLAGASASIGDGRYVAEFTKVLAEAGEARVGADLFVWARGDGGLGYHGRDVGALSLDLATCAHSRKRIASTSSAAVRAHGAFMIAAFAASMPLAVVIGRGRGLLKGGPRAAWWIKGHAGFNVAALALAAGGFFAVFTAVGDGDGDHFDSKHSKAGVAVLALALAAALAGLARPKVGTPTRAYFNVGHAGLGYAVLLLAAVATRSGVGLAVDREHIDDKRAWYRAQGGLLAAALVALVGVTVADATRRSLAADAVADVASENERQGPGVALTAMPKDGDDERYM